MMPRIFLLRHGHSVANEEGRIASRIANAGEAYGLTPRGREQVRGSTRDALAAGCLAPPVLLASSPLLRARQSAEEAGEILGVRTGLDERLRERDFGELELDSDRRYAEVWQADREDPTRRLSGVESVLEVLRRAGGLVGELVGRKRGGSVILCTHGDVASVLLCASLGARLGTHREVGALGTGELREIPSVDRLMAELRALDPDPGA